MKRRPDAMNDDERMVTAQAVSLGIHAGILTLLSLLVFGGVLGPLLRTPKAEALQASFIPQAEIPVRIEIPSGPASEPPPLPAAAAEESGGAPEPKEEEIPDVPPPVEPRLGNPAPEEHSAEGGRDPVDLAGDPVATVERSRFKVEAGAYAGQGRDLKRMAKLVYEPPESIQDVEAILKAHQELHLVFFASTQLGRRIGSMDALVIDSYTEGRWHILCDPGRDAFGDRPLGAKTFELRVGTEQAAVVKRLLRGIREDPDRIESVKILLPQAIWDRLFAVVEAALARKGLPRLEDERVVQVRTRYVKEENGYGFRAVSAIMKMDGIMKEITLER